MNTAAHDLVVAETAAVGLARGEAVVLDAWLGDVHARALRLEILALVDARAFHAAGVGAGADHVVDRQVRRDSVCWFDDDGVGGVQPGVEVAGFLARIDGLVAHLNATCFLALCSVECHAACYEAGAYYGAHKDTLQRDGRRVISYCYYLNDTWMPAAGGCLRLHGAPDVDVAPLLDRLVVFRSADISHEVMPTSVRRLSLTGWLSRAG
jgi:SM-20-related protein